MTVEQLRAKYWRLRAKFDSKEACITPTIDREIAMLQAELLVEIAVQLEEAKQVLNRVGVLNFEEIALRLEDLFRKTQE
jgi:hypothetical protein